MSEELTAVKRRGRPKKKVEVETIILIDSSASTGPTALIEKGTSKTPRASKIATESSEKTATPRKRVQRKDAVNKDTRIEMPKAVKTKNPAKNIEGAMTASSQSGVPARSKISRATKSTILEQATAFVDTHEQESILKEGDSPASNIVGDSQSVNIPQPDSLTTAQANSQQRLNDTQTRFDNLVTEIRGSAIECVELSILGFTGSLQRQSHAISKLRVDLKRQANFASQLQNIRHKTSNLESTTRLFTTEVQRLRQTTTHNKRLQQYSTFEQRLNSIETTLTEAHTQHYLPLATTLAHRRNNHIQNLNNRLQTLTDNIHQSQTTLQDLEALQPSHAHPNTPTQTQSQSMPTSMQSRLTTSSTPRPLSTTSPSHRPTPRQPPPQVQPQPQIEPRAPRPTELPYDVLRKDPRFKSQSRKWTGIIVGIPIIIATSWVLYDRYQDVLEKRRLEEQGGMGVRRRSSNVGVNGGV